MMLITKGHFELKFGPKLKSVNMGSNFAKRANHSILKCVK